jgi:alkylation response protein AidB-like acyl-CoA dehydrogenase
MSQHNTEHLDTEEQRAFRLKARDWMKGRLPPRRMRDEPVMDFADKDLVDKDKAIQKALWDGGLAGITVPKEYGGQGLSLRFEDILHEEAEPYRLPWHFGNAFVVVLPTLLKHGRATTSGASCSPSRREAPTWQGCSPAPRRSATSGC